MVYAAGELLARVEGGEVRWEHRQPATGGRWESGASLAPRALTELDPLGADVGTESPYEPGITPAEPAIFDAGSHWASRAGSPADPRSGCAVNGMELPCEVFLRMIDDGVLSMRVNDPRGPGQMELPLSGWGLGPVWVDTSDQLRPGLYVSASRGDVIRDNVHVLFCDFNLDAENPEHRVELIRYLNGLRSMLLQALEEEEVWIVYHPITRITGDNPDVL